MADVGLGITTGEQLRYIFYANRFSNGIRVELRIYHTRNTN